MTSRSRRKKEASKQRIVNKSLNNSARNLRNPPKKKKPVTSYRATTIPYPHRLSPSCCCCTTWSACRITHMDFTWRFWGDDDDRPAGRQLSSNQLQSPGPVVATCEPASQPQSCSSPSPVSLPPPPVLALDFWGGRWELRRNHRPFFGVHQRLSFT